MSEPMYVLFALRFIQSLLINLGSDYVKQNVNDKEIR